MGVDRVHDLRGRAGQRAVGVGREVDDQLAAGHGHRQRRVGGAGVAEGGEQVVAALVAVGQRLDDHRLLGRGGGEVADLAGVRGAEVDAHDGVRGATVAVREVGEVDDLGQVRELARQRDEPVGDLGRVHVAREEAAQVARGVRRPRRADPLGHRRLVDAAGARRHPHALGLDVRHPHEVAVEHVDVVVRDAGLRVAVDRHVRRGAEHAVGAGEAERHRRAAFDAVGRDGRRGLGVGLDVQEAARVVRERVGAHDRDLARERDRVLGALRTRRRAALSEFLRARVAREGRVALGHPPVGRGSASRAS